jgi:hypothetical protein
LQTQRLAIFQTLPREEQARLFEAMDSAERLAHVRTATQLFEKLEGTDDGVDAALLLYERYMEMADEEREACMKEMTAVEQTALVNGLAARAGALYDTHVEDIDFNMRPDMFALTTPDRSAGWGKRSQNLPPQNRERAYGVRFIQFCCC